MKAEFTPIDELGMLQAQIAELTKRVEQIKDAIKDDASLSGTKSFEGTLFKATYVETNRSTVDWKGIAAVLSIPAELIAEHTKTAAVYSVKVTAK
jgi:hypothetical protein